MKEELQETQIRKYIDEYLAILIANFDVKTKKKISYNEIFELISDLHGLFNLYAEKNHIEAGKLVIKKYIPLLDMLIKIDKNKDNCAKYEQYIKNAYRIAARISFEH